MSNPRRTTDGQIGWMRVKGTWNDTTAIDIKDSHISESADFRRARPE
jgi:hypothetical protein